MRPADGGYIILAPIKTSLFLKYCSLKKMGHFIFGVLKNKFEEDDCGEF
jgi:hypothetical protein